MDQDQDSRPDLMEMSSFSSTNADVNDLVCTIAIDQALSDKRASHLYPSGFDYHTFKALFHPKIKKKLSFRAAGFHPVQV